MVTVTAEQLEAYKGLTAGSMKKGFGSAVYAYRRGIDAEARVQAEHGVNLPFYLAQQYHINGKSITELSEELGLGKVYIKDLFEYLSIPRLTPEEARMRDVRLHKGVHGMDPVTGESYASIGRRTTAGLGTGIYGFTHEEQRYNASKGGKMTAKLGAGIHTRSKEEMRRVGLEQGKLAVEQGKGIYALNETERHNIAVKGGIASVKLQRGIHASSGEERSEAARKGGKRTATLYVGVHSIEAKKKTLRTQHGYRTDVPYHAKSAWEANIYRLLSYLGFEIEHDVPIALDVGESERYLFPSPATRFNVDFKATTSVGAEYWYEIIADSRETPLGTAKVRMFQEQNPDKKLIIITARKYRALERAFSAAIKKDGRFSGWETIGDNLKTNPEKYAPKSA
ncbi:MAG: hypothetical protein HY365_03675 [Candidatus Aenigmarchaeota archaeon]|nr:hypothetical protein [Candidatus Aenigmarchaeota archaeon]